MTPNQNKPAHWSQMNEVQKDNWNRRNANPEHEHTARNHLNPNQSTDMDLSAQPSPIHKTTEPPNVRFLGAMAESRSTLQQQEAAEAPPQQLPLTRDEKKRARAQQHKQRQSEATAL